MIDSHICDFIQLKLHVTEFCKKANHVMSSFRLFERRSICHDGDTRLTHVHTFLIVLRLALEA